MYVAYGYTYVDIYSIVVYFSLRFVLLSLNMLSLSTSAFVKMVLTHFRDQLRNWFQGHCSSIRDHEHDHLTFALERIHQRWNTINCVSRCPVIKHAVNRTCATTVAIVCASICVETRSNSHAHTYNHREPSSVFTLVHKYAITHALHMEHFSFLWWIIPMLSQTYVLENSYKWV